ncbi:MAG TPA: hypothetical protein VFU06_09205 [Longimicrobiales bacterium]|nr:hypothetical protein [Longimicrobiales bacterium]
MDKYSFLMYERAGTVMLDPVGTVLSLLVVVAVGMMISSTRLPHTLKQLLYAALAFRVIGAVARYVVLFAVYAGSGDARKYYRESLYYAEQLWAFNPAPLFDPQNWWAGRWWGTQFVYFIGTLVHMLVGASMPGGYIVFSLFAFAGLYCFMLAFQRTYPHVPTWHYARWIFFFPALWFWPSSIGKEAIVLMGMGFATLGYVGRAGRINWLLLTSGVLLVFAIRPEVAAVVISSLLAAHWLSLITSRWTLRNTMQAAVLIGAGLLGLYYAMRVEGIELDPDSVQTYMADSQGRAVEGTSNIEAVPVGISGIPLALINILFRPFIWEASSLMVLITSVEIMSLWLIAWYRRATLVRALRHWRHDRLLRVAVPFILAYAVSLGMVIANMGIVARQRIFLFPFLFLLIEAVPRVAVHVPAAVQPARGRVRPLRPLRRPVRPPAAPAVQRQAASES